MAIDPVNKKNSTKKEGLSSKLSPKKIDLSKAQPIIHFESKSHGH